MCYAEKFEMNAEKPGCCRVHPGFSLYKGAIMNWSKKHCKHVAYKQLGKCFYTKIGKRATLVGYPSVAYYCCNMSKRLRVGDNL